MLSFVSRNGLLGGGGECVCRQNHSSPLTYALKLTPIQISPWLFLYAHSTEIHPGAFSSCTISVKEGKG